jgi:broad specificity phosphatase PhoE
MSNTVFLVRHGERADNAGLEEQTKIKLDFDPHLTELGKIQASYAGKEIRKLIFEGNPKGKKKTCLFVSSPFLRCIQTAYHASTVFDENEIYEGKIFLDNSICELLTKQFFTSPPLEQIFARTRKEELKTIVTKKIQDGIVENEHACTPSYPETLYDIMKKHDKFMALLEKINKDVKTDDELVIIAFTHGYGVQGVLEGIEQFDFTKGVEYTSITHFEYDKDTKKLTAIKVQEHGHLEDAEKEYLNKTCSKEVKSL